MEKVNRMINQNKKTQYKIINGCIALIWLTNGLVCKLLNFVPRHQQIVSKILGNQYSEIITMLIGISEIMMGLWILSDYKARINAIVQIAIIMTMNILEFIIAPDLLLWGHFNIVFAIMLCSIIYYNQFVVYKHLSKTS